MYVSFDTAGQMAVIPYLYDSLTPPINDLTPVPLSYWHMCSDC